MKKNNFFMVMIIAISILLFTNNLISENKILPNEKSDHQMIKKVVEGLYVKGLKTRIFSLIREACIPETKLMNVNKNGTLQITTLDQWSKKFNPKKPPFKTLSWEIVKIEIKGTAAQVKLNFLINNKQKVTDFLQMLKIKNHWKIVHITDF